MYKLLIVDDEAVIRKGILCSIDWNRLNIEAFEADNGLTAYDMISKEKYDIVLSDIKMPGLSGLELIRKVRNSLANVDTIFIILSGYAEFSLASEAMKEGIKYYLLKPTAEEEIVSTLEKVIIEMKEKSISHDKVYLMFNTITAYINEGNLNDAQEEMKALFSILEECKMKEVYVNYCVELFVLIIRQCEDASKIPHYLRMSSKFDINTPLEEMYNKISEVITEIINTNKNISSVKHGECVQLILDYIDENISSEELSLSHISRHLFMNSDYIGKMFKKEMKENYKDYISRIRVENAQELIQTHPSNKMCQIAEKTGFGCNSQYFSQVFKKHTGFTPKEYREMLIGDKVI